MAKRTVLSTERHRETESEGVRCYQHCSYFFAVVFALSAEL